MDLNHRPPGYGPDTPTQLRQLTLIYFFLPVLICFLVQRQKKSVSGREGGYSQQGKHFNLRTPPRCK